MQNLFLLLPDVVKETEDSWSSVFIGQTPNNILKDELVTVAVYAHTYCLAMTYQHGSFADFHQQWGIEYSRGMYQLGGISITRIWTSAHSPWPALTLTFDLQNLIRSSVGASDVSSISLKMFTRHHGKICLDKWIDKWTVTQHENMMLSPTLYLTACSL